MGKGFRIMTWQEYDQLIDAMADDLDSFQTKNNLKFDAAIPILRGGAIPAVSLAYRLRIEAIYPIRLYHDYEGKGIGVALNTLKDFGRQEKRSPLFLLVDDYSATGKTAGCAARVIRESVRDAQIVFASLGRDVCCPEEDNYMFQSAGFWANELDSIPTEECARRNILNVNTVFPWEIPEDEIQNLTRLEQEFYPARENESII